MQTIDGVDYMDVDEAASLLGVKKATLYAYVSRGTLQSFRQGVGRKRLYQRKDVEALLMVRRDEESIHIDDDAVARDVHLPDAASWAGEH
ncbi:MAG: helix-turn-helix domain-containing protein [Kouleothrix sp.]|nr:helix-turn-helix domain-containing protein [Kouleothrix sp.]